MRTAMNLPDSLMERVRRKADREGRTVTSLMEEALRDLVNKDRDTLPEVTPLPTWSAPGQRMQIDIDDKDALWEVLDADGYK
jgi:hypothetical protein